MAKQTSTGNRSARETAAAARAASVAAEKRRQRMINLTIAVVIGAVVFGIVGGALLVSNNTKEQNGATTNPDSAAPVGAYPADSDLAFGIPYGSNPDAPQLVAWEDFQCPGCQAFEASAGAAVKERADKGEIYQVTRMATFLDTRFATDHSRRATAAYGCAVDAGKGMEYKETVYANPPATEGAGWTDEQLIDFGRQVGIEGDAFTTFESCFTDRTYIPWAANSNEQFQTLQIPSTPYLTLNGKEVDAKQVADPAGFQQLIDEANAAK